ncbi:MAG TPA: M48 family metallopeptidase [Candidatus Competibacteraceae bacterium]|nr:M48 family metallopeptidase [Candidatus Competibacteraceae bacterium]
MVMRSILLLVFLVILTACDQSPTGRQQLALLPESKLAAMGAQTFAEMKRTQPLETHPQTWAYVRCVARAIIQVLPADQRQGWEIAVFRDSTPNAFALPGRKIGVNTGMLTVAATPGQLAAVIGHEVGHVLARHANERATQELAVQGGIALIDLLYQSHEGWKHEALRNALGLGATYGVLLPFSRTHEREADTLGLELMADAGFNPRESLALWRTMARAGGRQPLEFLSTHPSPESRFQELETQLGPAEQRYQATLTQGRQLLCEN